MRRKYLFFDVDGTLLPFGSPLPESAKAVLFRAKARGHKLFLSTGRSKAEVDPGLFVIPFDGGVYAGGASVEAEGKLIYNLFFSKEEVDYLYNLALERGWVLIVQGSSGSYLTREGNEFLQSAFIKYIGKPLVINGLNILPEYPRLNDITKLNFMTRDFDVEQVRKLLSPSFDVIDNSMGVPASFCGEIVKKGCSKARGLFAILSHYGANAEDCIAFGDGANDVEIIESAGIGVAMGNASASLKAKADFITKDADSDGIEYALEQLGVV